MEIVAEPFRDIINILLNLVFSVHTVSHGSPFFPYEGGNTRSITQGTDREDEVRKKYAQ